MPTETIRLSALLAVCLLASVGCNRSDNAEALHARAEAEAAKAEAAKEKSRADAAIAELAKAKELADAAEGQLSKLKATAPQPSPVGDSRKAAEWVLGISGIVNVAAGDKVTGIHGPDGKLPNEPFEITEIRLPGGNKVTNDNIKIISGLKTVSALHATGSSKLTEFGFLKGMSNLRVVSFQDTDVDDSCLSHLKDCRKMEVLSIGGNYQNHVTDDGLQIVKDMKFLTLLDILGTRVSDAGLRHLKDLTNLTYLAMGNHGVRTDITDKGLANLAGMNKLETLIIVNAAVSDAGLEHIKKLTSLKRVHLAKTNVTDAGVASLKKSLPNCNVELSK